MDGSFIGSNRVAQESFTDGPGLVLERVSIESLPDDVLLEIFCQVRLGVSKPASPAEKLFVAQGWGPLKSAKDLEYLGWHLNWPKLVQVCRRWRFLVFASPKRLELQLYCTPETPVRKLLDIWPIFPLVVGHHSPRRPSEDKFDNVIAALEHRDRVQEITFGYPLTTFFWERIATLMEEPFPELTSLSLSGVLSVPGTFLNGSASRLQVLYLWGFSFPSLPRLLSSTRDLTTLHLYYTPNSWYTLPETMVTYLSESVLPKLEFFSIQFQSWTTYSKRRNRSVPLPTRSVLPALTELDLQGTSEYIEDLMARIDAPRLHHVKITLFKHPVFDIPQTIQFLTHLDSFKTSGLNLVSSSSFSDVSRFYFEVVERTG